MTMNALRKNIRIFGSHAQHGAALVIAILILLVLTVIGIYAVSTSIFETKISGFEREFKEAFYTADSGNPMGIVLIKTIIQDLPETLSDLPDPWKDPGVIDTNLFSGTDPEIFTDNRAPDNLDPSDPTNYGPDIDSQQDGTTPPDGNLGLPSRVQLKVDIDRLKAYQMSGGAQQFAAGYEGIGGGGGGSIGIIYATDSLGRYSGAESGIEGGYLHVVGVPGGE
jgi:hypothetical protein